MHTGVQKHGTALTGKGGEWMDYIKNVASVLEMVMVTVQDVLDAIDDCAHYPDAMLHAGDLKVHLAHAMRVR